MSTTYTTGQFTNPADSIVNPYKPTVPPLYPNPPDDVTTTTARVKKM